MGRRRLSNRPPGTNRASRRYLHLGLPAPRVHLVRASQWKQGKQHGSQTRHTATITFCFRLSSSISSWYALATTLTGPGVSWSGLLLRGLSWDPDADSLSCEAFFSTAAAAAAAAERPETRPPASP